MIENSPLSNLFARCMRSLAPAHMVEGTEIRKTQFEKLLYTAADNAKSEYSNLVNIVLKENR